MYVGEQAGSKIVHGEIEGESKDDANGVDMVGMRENGIIRAASLYSALLTAL